MSGLRRGPKRARGTRQSTSRPFYIEAVRLTRDHFVPPDPQAFLAAEPPTGRVIVIAPTRAACETIELALGLHLDTLLEREHGDDLRRLAASGRGFGIVAATGTGKTLAVRPIAETILQAPLRGAGEGAAAGPARVLEGALHAAGDKRAARRGGVRPHPGRGRAARPGRGRALAAARDGVLPRRRADPRDPAVPRRGGATAVPARDDGGGTIGAQHPRTRHRGDL